MMEDAKEADVDTLMRYIRVLSELSNDMKTSTQKRVKAEVTFIKLMRPSMEKPADMTELTGRINTLETQLGDAMQVIEKLKSGELIPAGMLMPWDREHLQEQTVLACQAVKQKPVTQSR